MPLPVLPRAVGKYEAEAVALRGINYADDVTPGDLLESENLSTRRWPVIAARCAREKQTDWAGVTALGAWEGLVAVRGTDLVYNGAVVGAVAPGEKQFAVVNTKLVIWPDRRYLDMEAMVIRPLEAEVTGTGAAFTGDTVTFTGEDWTLMSESFKAGDTVELRGCERCPENNKFFTVRAVGNFALTADADTFAEGTESGELTVAREVPDMDFICASENRLWGCSNAARSVYASALGDPTNFNTFEALSTDSFAAAVGSAGDFTGCCRLAGAVLFWKENRLHKVLGSYPEEYELTEYALEGVRAGCHRSMVIVNDVLYYMGTHGVYAYNGGTPACISRAFGNRDFRAGVAGSDGLRYYLSVLEGGTTPHLLVYDFTHGLWLREDATRCTAFARLGTRLYFCDGAGDLWLADSGIEDPEIVWSAHFAPLYETVLGRKRWRRLRLRFETPKGKTVRAECRFPGGPWRPVGSVTGRFNGPERDTVSFCIPIARADAMELRLTGSGVSAIRAVSREFLLGSER